MIEFTPYLLISLSALATVVGIWNVKKSDLKERRMVIIKSFLTFFAISTLVFSALKFKDDNLKSLSTAHYKHMQDSITISILTDTRKNTSFIKQKTDSILLDVKTSADQLVNTFKYQKDLLNQSFRLQNPLPQNFVSTFYIKLFNKKLYDFSSQIRRPAHFFNSPAHPDTTAEYKKIAGILKSVLKDFEVSLWFKSKKANEPLISAGTKIDLNNLIYQYDKPDPMYDLRPSVVLTFDDNAKCLQLIVLNINIQTQFKSKKVFAISDLEGSTLFMKLNYKNAHTEDYNQEGESKVEQVFDKIALERFFLSADFDHVAVYPEIQDNLGMYVFKNFSWKDHFLSSD
jgi:hypothetical protein